MAFWIIRAWRRAQHVGRPEESIFRPPVMLITAEIGVREIQVTGHFALAVSGL